MNKAGKQIHLEFARNANITGKGIGIAVMDTGISPHPDFTKSENRIAAFYDVLHKRNNIYDDSGHGTHVSSILAGNGFCSHGTYAGVAPEASIIAVKVLDRYGNGTIPDVLQGAAWILAHKDEYNIRVVNISVGSRRLRSQQENNRLLAGIEKLWTSGLVVVVAAGNGGPAPKSIGLPGSSKKVITVGACDDHIPVKLPSGEMVDYSGRGPTEDCIMKPDIVAPGGHIIGCAPVSNRVVLTSDGWQKYYCMKSGTSMATPMVSGAVALLLSKYPQMTNREVKIRLKNASTDLGLPRRHQGWGMLNLEHLLR